MNTMYGKATSFAMLVVVLSATVCAFGQAASTATSSISRNWDDFVYYIQIARPDGALSHGKAIVEADPAVDPREVYYLSIKTDSVVDILARGEKLPGLADVIQKMHAIIESGYKLVNRDPAEISKAIEKLGGNLRERSNATDRLVGSGEYAIPQLIARLGDAKIPAPQRDQIMFILGKMGKAGVRPLSVALESPDPAIRMVVCQALGRLEYRHSAPYLRALLANPQELVRVKASAETALQLVTNDPAAGSKPVAQYFYELANDYYVGRQSLLPDARFDLANVWYWKAAEGILTYHEVSTSVFMDLYAMRCARESLEADNTMAPAVSLWLAANLRKEAHLQPGQKDMPRPQGHPQADYYALASGAKYMHAVLARALRDDDVAVAKGAIRALARTAGAENLVCPVAGGVTPLVSALSFRDRRVRLMAGETLAGARPITPFAGSELVVPVLVETLRQTGKSTVLLIEPDETRRNRYKEMIRQSGYDVIDADHYASGVHAVYQTTGVDLAVIGCSIAEPGPAESLAMLRAEPLMSTLSVVFVATQGELAQARRLAQDDEMVTIVQAEDLDNKAKLQAALQTAGAKSLDGGPMDDAEAAQWAMKAAKSLRMLGLTRTPIFRLERAEKALVDGLSDARDDQKIACAQALAVQGSGTAQQAIVDLAAKAISDEVRIAAYLAAAESVRLIGNQLDETRAAGLVAVVSSPGDLHIRNAASVLLGALDLPSEKIKALILQTKSSD